MTPPHEAWLALHDFRLWTQRRMRERRWSQRELAARSGVDHSTVSRLLSGDRQDPLLSTAVRIVEALL